MGKECIMKRTLYIVQQPHTLYLVDKSGKVEKREVVTSVAAQDDSPAIDKDRVRVIMPRGGYL
jgi:hypothetical protein